MSKSDMRWYKHSAYWWSAIAGMSAARPDWILFATAIVLIGLCGVGVYRETVREGLRGDGGGA